MQLSANGIHLEVDDRGPAAGEPLLLVMGLGMQLIAWPEGLVDALVARGFRVVRLDNRDAGLSQSFDAAGRPALWLEALRHRGGWPLRPAYTLADMADDCAGVLEALGLRSAHVWGASMGGMIAQHLAHRHPHRVRSLGLVMTSSGAPTLPGPHWRLATLLLTPPRPDDRDAAIAHLVRIHRAIGSPRWPTPPDELRRRVATAVRRSHRPDGTARQFVAIAADGDRSRMLPEIRCPTTVLHGEHDPLVPVAAAHDLARLIPQARLVTIDGMGHDLPEALWPRFVDEIVRGAGR
ncbi:alpha/beta hydrolase [Piscinibacter sakaiensis]|uniref:Hydrolase, alpha/beta fold family n=1 Tax=Piscinibacter sakaiensis TaxID=1547922 RepID=A0A0K8NXQ6_PISS1|nr:alpha/beta hydrolase [Piscinibacter sakaiensis]GAP34715.1 hydrolase, alpha/beta fold family [Piscinibacter sakaiensis]